MELINQSIVNLDTIIDFILGLNLDVRKAIQQRDELEELRPEFKTFKESLDYYQFTL